MSDSTAAEDSPEQIPASQSAVGLAALSARARAVWTASRPGRWWIDQQIGERIHCWWEGFEFVARAPMPVVEPSTKGASAEKPTVSGWPATRLEVVQTLFGEGMIAPAEATTLVKMITPLGLNEKMTVIELGAGLGGLARVVASETGAYVTAFEADPLLVKAGMELSAKHGLSKKAAVKQAPPNGLEARPKSVDAVLAKEAFFTVEDKPALFGAIRKALKPGGQLMLSDYMLAGDASGPAIAAWAEKEPHKPFLWTIPAMRGALEELGLVVSIVEDVTTEYRGAAIGAFANLAERINSGEIGERMCPWAVSEGEFWSRRLALLASGEVKIIRLYARLPAVKELT